MILMVQFPIFRPGRKSASPINFPLEAPTPLAKSFPPQFFRKTLLLLGFLHVSTLHQLHTLLLRNSISETSHLTVVCRPTIIITTPSKHPKALRSLFVPFPRTKVGGQVSRQVSRQMLMCVCASFGNYYCAFHFITSSNNNEFE